ncbi:WcaA Glycosyltransferases involved in cell wall biogenesis [Flavobacteriaceae bacterium]
MTNQSLISVIVPCYKQAQFLPETLQSVLNQTYSNWECIIVNDGSPDQTEQVAQEWCSKDNRFKYIKKENGGLSSARNAGIAVCKGEYILPLDSDDKIQPIYLEKINKAFYDNPELKLVSSRIQFFGAKNTEYILSDYSYKNQLVTNCFVCCSSFKKADWERLQGYDEQMKSFEDWEFWIRLLDDKSEVYKIPEVMFLYRKHDNGSLSNTFNTNHDFYYGLYDYVYNKNQHLYNTVFGNPIFAYQENMKLKKFNQKIKNTIFFKLYVKIKKVL